MNTLASCNIQYPYKESLNKMGPKRDKTSLMINETYILEIMVVCVEMTFQKQCVCQCCRLETISDNLITTIHQTYPLL